MHNKKISKFPIGLIIVVFIILVSTNQSFAILKKFSPVHMQTSALLMNNFFKNLIQDKDSLDIVREGSFSNRYKEYLVDLRLCLFKLQSYLEGFQQRATKKNLDEAISEFAAAHIRDSVNKIDEYFSAFFNKRLLKHIKERYSQEKEIIDANLKKTLKYRGKIFMNDVMQNLNNPKRLDEHSDLLSSLQNELLSLDITIIEFKNALEQKN
jgi:hypothetical protein